MTWPMVKLGEVLRQSEDWITLHPDQMYKEVTVRLWGNGAVLRREVMGAEIASSSRLRVRTNQFIISRIDARNGAYGIIPPELDGAVVSNDFPVFDTNPERLDVNYLRWLSRTKEFVALCTAASEGTTNRVRLKGERFLSTEIPLPPLVEQRRLVARIDALAAKIDEAKRLRAEADAERCALVSATAQTLFTNEMPTVKVVDVAEVRGGIQKSPERTAGANPVRYLTVAHVQRNRIVLTDPRFFEVSREELPRWSLQAGDVLIIEGNGSADQIGRTALFGGEIHPCVHQNHVIRLRPDTSQIMPEYLNAYLNSPVGQDAVQAESRTTSGLRSLSVGRIKHITIRLPAIQQQRQIVAGAVLGNHPATEEFPQGL
jgi:type I restriction enzyme S subunit